MNDEKTDISEKKEGRPYRRLRKGLWWTTAVAAGLAVVLLLLPIVMQHFIEKWLSTPEKEHVSIADVDFNPFSGAFVLKGVEVRDNNGIGLSFRRGAVRIKWLPLLDRHLKLKEIRLDDGKLDVGQSDGNWSIASYSLISQPSGEEEASKGWEWTIGEIELRDVDIRYNDPLLTTDIGIKSLIVQGLDTVEAERKCRFQMSAKLGEGSIDMKGEASPFIRYPGITGDVILRNFPVKMIEPYLKGESIVAFEGMGEGKAKVSAVFKEKDGTDIDIDGTVVLKDGRYEFPSGVIKGTETTWNGSTSLRGADSEGSGEIKMSGVLSVKGIDLELPEGGLSAGAGDLRIEGGLDFRDELNVVGTVSAQGFKIDDIRKELNLVDSSDVEIDGFTLSGDENIEAKEVRFTGTRLFERKKGGEEPSHILDAESLRIKGVHYRLPRRIEIENIEISGGEGRLTRDADGNFDLIKWFDTPDKKKVSSIGEKTTILLRGTRLSEENRIVLRDETLRPPYAETFTFVSADLGAIDSGDPRKSAPVSVQGRIGKYADLKLNGALTPFALDALMSLKGRLSSFDLTSIDPYARRNLDYSVRQGNLDAEIDWRIEGGIIDSEIGLVMTKLEIKQVRNNGSERFEQILGLPVQSALSLLRDRKDDIRLRLVFDGNLDDPNLSVRDLVTRATRTAVQKAAVSYFAPMGVTLLTGVTLPPGTLYVAGKVLDWATTMRFEPVIFLPEETEIDEDAKGYLDRMAKLLEDRPDVRVVLCGKTSRSDLGDEKVGEKPLPPLTEDESKRLLELAGERAIAVKDALVARGVDPGRILICTPVLDRESTGSPRVEITL